MTWAPRPGDGRHQRRSLWPAGLLIGTGLLGLALFMVVAQSPDWGPAMMGAGNTGMMGALSSATAAGTLPLADIELRRRLEAFAASRWPASRKRCLSRSAATLRTRPAVPASSSSRRRCSAGSTRS